MDIQITNNTDAHRFETTVDGHTAYVEYTFDGDTMIFPHTLVPDAIGGQGIGSQLAKAALDWAKEEGYAIQPDCPFIRSYVEKHPEYQ